MAAAKNNRAIIAVNRFGLGARGNELSDAKHDPEQWLLRQLVNPVFDPTLGNTESAFNVISEIKEFKRKRQQGESNAKPNAKLPSRLYQQRLLKDSLNFAVQTDTPLSMRILDFFSNHFSVSASSQSMKVLSPILEREAIAPNLFGQFEDLLIAVEQHPAMIFYLNNERSAGPNSQRGNKKRGLNENLAREILELHTLGVDGGYRLQDITELALAISGWSITNENDVGRVGFKFRNKSHEPGERNILGTSYAEAGLTQGHAVLRDLARHKKTAQFVSHKLAQHLIADEPPKELVAAMIDSWIRTDGNIKAVISTLVKNPLSWDSRAQKFKTPREFVVSTFRAVNNAQIIDQSLLNIGLRGLGLMGQTPFDAGSPAGYSQLNRAWTGSNALMKRIDWVNLVSKRVRETPQPIVNRIFDSHLSPLTVKLVAGAESRAQGLALLLLSPEFQRR